MKDNNKGFTLIELLAVIVILAVLMITAIPAVTSAIAKSRRDTYATNAKKIIDAVRTSVLNEEFLGQDGTTCQLPGPGKYISVNLLGNNNSTTVIQKLLERGGTNSSFNKPYSSGYVYISNQGTAATTTTTGTDKYVYYIYLIDSGNNGIGTTTAENDLTRNKVYIGSVTQSSITVPGTQVNTCSYNG